MKQPIVLLTLVLLTFYSVAQTTISAGYISGTLTAAGGPYTVTGDVTVPSDSLLVIEPGVSLYFADTTKLIVRGNIKAIGTEDNEILFTKSGTDSLRGWGGIFLLNDPQSDTNYFEYCEIKYASPSVSRYFDWLVPNKFTFSAGINAQQASPLRVTSCTFGKQGRSIECIETDLILLKSVFVDASPFQKDPFPDYFTKFVVFNDGYLQVEECIFDKSSFGLAIGEIDNFLDYNVKNCEFRNIANRSLELFGKCNVTKCSFFKSGQFALRLNAFIGIVDQCTFDSSYGNSPIGKNIALIGSAASSIVQNCTFKNTKINERGLDNFDITASNGGLPVIYNCTFDNALGIINDGTAFSPIINCKIINCPTGFDIYGSINIMNSLFVNNKGRGVVRSDNDSFLLYFSPALNVGVGTVNVYNSIFWNNYDQSNTKNNIRLYENGDVKLYNCILDGGKTGITKFGDPSFVFAGTYQDCSSTYPGFVDTANGDFRPYQDCNQTPNVLNKGYALPIRGRYRAIGSSTATFYDDILAQLADAEGNPRVWNDTVDIGPYEMPLRKSVELYEHPTTLELCEDESGEMQASARGLGVSMLWQSSSDGARYTSESVTAENLVLANVPAADSGLMYRARWYNQCGDTLYSNPALLKVHLPTPISLGEDFRLSIDSSARLSPGQGFSKYEWGNGSVAPIINIRGEQLGLGEHTFSVSVTNRYGCISADSITVTVAIINGVRSYNASRELLVYPNPGKNTVKVKGLNEFSYSIYSTTGKELYSNTTATGDIDTKSLQTGSYLIRIQQDDAYYMLRWVKM